MFIQTIQCGVCPSPDRISPCTCRFDRIKCDGKGRNINLGEVFEALSNNNTPGEQYWKIFLLKNTTIELLPEDVFRGIKFKILLFADNPNLTCVHPYAFGGNATKLFNSENTNFAAR